MAKTADRVWETSTDTGTGTFDLDGPVTAHRGFLDASNISDGDTVFYTIGHRSQDQWESGEGTIQSGSPDTLQRDTVIDSSNGGSKVDFNAGTKNVLNDLKAERAVALDSAPSSGDIAVYGASGWSVKQESALNVAFSSLSGSIGDGQVPASAVTQHEGSLSIAGSQVDSGTLPDARIQESGVTQHEGAIDHDALTNFTSDEHRPFLIDSEDNRPSAGTQGRYFYNTSRERLEFDTGSVWIAVASGEPADFPILFSYSPGDPITYHGGSFSRASDATARDYNRQLITESSGELRDWHFVEDSSIPGSPLVRATRLEAARTNSCLHSEDFTDAAWDKSLGTTGVTITADDADAPDVSATADLVTPGGAADDGLEQTYTVADDSLDRAIFFFVEKGSSPQARVEIAYTGGTTEIAEWIDVDTADGSVVATSGGETRAGVEDSEWNGYWKVWIVASNNGSGNTTLRQRLRPDSADGGDAVHAWGAQLEGVSGGASSPSSYISTSGSAVSRAADNLSAPVSFGPQAITSYSRFYNLGWIVANGTGSFSRLWQIGDGGVRLLCFRETYTENIRIRYDGPNGGNNLAIVNTGAGYGDRVEILSRLRSNGDVEIEGYVNGTLQGSDTATGGADMASAWSDDTVYIGGGPYGVAEGLAFRNQLFIPGNRTIDTVRSLAGVS